MIESLIALVLLLLETRDIRFVELVGRTLLCGGALYYVFKHFTKQRAFTLWVLIFLLIGLAYNPVYKPHCGNVVWIVCDIVTMVAFYFLSLRTPVDEGVVTREEPQDY